MLEVNIHEWLCDSVNDSGGISNGDKIFIKINSETTIIVEATFDEWGDIQFNLV